MQGIVMKPPIEVMLRILPARRARATVAGAGVVIAEPAAKRDSNRYQLNYSMNRTQAGLIAIRVRVVDSETGTVVGTKWEDRNGNHERDGGEPGMAGVVVYADLNGNGRLDIIIPTGIGYTYLIRDGRGKTSQKKLRILSVEELSLPSVFIHLLFSPLRFPFLPRPPL